MALAAAGALISTGLVTAASPAHAFKPFTHVKTGLDARADAIDDGAVTIAGQTYAVNAAVVTALRDKPSYYNSGVIGPDGFPDLVMGQSIIHPENTGLWLRHILTEAWDAQTDPQWNSEQRKEILAFAYGYLTHASGDLWMHTMINQFANGTFPGVKEILTDAEKASIAIRHLVAEGYVGDATEEFDGNPDREVVPNSGGDVSDDSSPAIQFDAPKKWIYQTLVARSIDGDDVGPAQDRGALIDYFYNKRAALQADLDYTPDPLAASLAEFKETKETFEGLSRAAASADDGDSGDCSFGAGNSGVAYGVDVAYDIVACPIAIIGLGLQAGIDSLQAFTTLATETVNLALDAVVDAYRAAWIEDIDEGLKAWPELGLQMTRALFDPATRRAVQNEECEFHGAEDTQSRASCEDGIGPVDVVFEQLDPFINEHLLSMLGLPDVVGELRTLLDQAADAIDAIVGPALNPLRVATAEVKEWAKDILKDEINRRFGIDIDQIQDFLGSPSAKMDVGSTGLTLPVVGPVSVQLFRTAEDVTAENPETDHQMLDRYLGISGDHHGGAGGGLSDDVTFDKEGFAAYANTVTLNKLLLLDGAQLDEVMSDITGGSYGFYGAIAGSNIMTTPLPGVSDVKHPASVSDQQWLTLIDGDHAWRSNAQPVFSTPSAGENNFPVWESCVLRPAFRTLFTDWENDTDRDGVERGTTDGNGDGWLDAGENFPDLGDATSPDAQDATAPTSEVDVTGTTYTDGTGKLWVTGSVGLTVDAEDGYWPDSKIGVQVAVTGPSGPVTGQSGLRHDGDSIDLSGLADGPYTITTTAKDACATGTPNVRTVYVDNTPPTITITSPAASLYDTDDTPLFTWTATDAGSGVASQGGTFDGTARSSGYLLDMYTLEPGLHVVAVTAADQLGNSASSSRTFRLRATAVSLLSNVNRARAEGKIPDLKTYNGLRDKMTAAAKSHQKGQHPAEWNQMEAFVNLLLAQRGQGIDATVADRFIAYAKDLVQAGG